jgi:hypothetical protein
MIRQPNPEFLVRDADGDFWERIDIGTHVGWVQLLPDPNHVPLPWDRLAPHVNAVLVPLLRHELHDD